MFQRETNLVIFTLKFPYGHGETFIEEELEVLSKEFRNIYLVPLGSDSVKRQLRGNVEVLDLLNSASKRMLSFAQKVKVFKLFLKISISDSNRIKYYKEFRYFFSYFKNIYKNALVIDAWISRPENKGKQFVFYSYWFDESALLLSILKSSKRINKFCSRAHGFDLYEERNTRGFFLFREWQLKNVDKVYTVSQQGQHYLSNKYKSHKNKIVTAYLGTKNHNKIHVNAGIPFTIVSCSNIIELKRVKLIASIVIRLGFDLKWIHFGDGPDLADVNKIISSNRNQNIKCELKGRVSNEQLMKYYSENSIDLFINLSLSEGLPVSIMEALSFGIPVIATNVGGTAELVNETTGVLIDVNLVEEEVCKIITEIKFGKRKFEKQKIYNFYEENFDANKNYKLFAEELSMHSLVIE